MRLLILVFLAFALVAFFLPLFVLEPPNEPELLFSSYEVVGMAVLPAQLNRIASEWSGDVGVPNASADTGPMPLSLRVSWLMPVATLLAVLCSLLAMTGVFVRRIPVMKMAFIGAAFAIMAIFHTAFINAGVNAWLHQANQNTEYAGLT